MRASDTDAIKAYRFGGDTKPFKLSAKEIGRADDKTAIIARRQPDGKYLVAAVNSEGPRSEYPIGGNGYLCEKDQLPRTVTRMCRDMDKFCGRGGKMTDTARHRAKS